MSWVAIPPPVKVGSCLFIGDFNALMPGLPQMLLSSLNRHRVNAVLVEWLWFCQISERTMMVMVDWPSVSIPPFWIWVLVLQRLLNSTLISLTSLQLGYWIRNKFCQIATVFPATLAVEHLPENQASSLLVLPQGLTQRNPGTSSKHGHVDTVFFCSSLPVLPYRCQETVAVVVKMTDSWSLNPSRATTWVS